MKSQYISIDININILIIIDFYKIPVSHRIEIGNELFSEGQIGRAMAR